MNTTLADTFVADYKALRSGAAIRHLHGAQPLRVESDDRVDFLQRMTTNDVKSLMPGQSTVTILTSPTAHILFVFTVVALDDSLYLLPAPGQSDSLLHHLRGQIFFMDKVEIWGNDSTCIRVMGPLAAQILADIELVEIPESDNTVRLSGEVVTVKQDTYNVSGYDLAGPEEEIGHIVATLGDKGAVVLQNDDAYNLVRIEMGRPAPNAELIDRYNPLETGMGWAYSQTKGCFTGQEILARQTNYDKITKSLVGLTSNSPIAAGEAISVDGKQVGEITSSAYSHTLERHIALAVVRRPYNSSGLTVQIGDRDATVVELPFTPTSSK